LFDKAKEMLRIAENEEDFETLVKLSRLVESLIMSNNADLCLKMFGETHWKFTFKALEYQAVNFDIEAKLKKHKYVEFLEKKTKMMVVDKSAMNEGFEELVKLKFRVEFYSEFVTDKSALELMNSNFQMVSPLLTAAERNLERAPVGLLVERRLHRANLVPGRLRSEAARRRLRLGVFRDVQEPSASSENGHFAVFPRQERRPLRDPQAA
jgi:hypothetical protein